MKKLLESLRTRPVMGDVAKPDMMSEARDQGVPAKLSARALPMASGNELDEVSLPFNARTGRAIRGDAFETTVNVLVNSYEGERGDAAAIEAHLDANVEDAIRNNMGGRGGRSDEKPSAADIRAVRRHVMYDLGIDPEGAFSGKVKGTASNKPRMQDANRLYDAYVRIDPYDRGEVKAYLQGPVVAYAEKYGLNVRKLQKMTKRAIEQGGYFDSFDEFLKDVLRVNEMNEAVHSSKKRCNESMCERVQACTSEAAMKQLTEMAASIYAEALNKDETLPAAIMANYIADQIQAEMQMFEAAEMEEEMDDLAPSGIPETDLEDYEDDKQYR